MKLAIGILIFGMAGTTWAQNPDVIQDTKSTLNAVQQKQKNDSNAALAATQGQQAAPSKTATNSQTSSASKPSTAQTAPAKATSSTPVPGKTASTQPAAAPSAKTQTAPAPTQKSSSSAAAHKSSSPTTAQKGGSAATAQTTTGTATAQKSSGTAASPTPSAKLAPQAAAKSATQPAAQAAAKPSTGKPQVVSASQPATKPATDKAAAQKAAASTAAAKAPAKPKTKATTIEVKKTESKPAVAVEDKKNPDAKDAKKEEPKQITMAGGRRDPFLSPVVSRVGGSGCSTGKRCLAIDQIALQGIVKSDAGMIAVVVNALNKAYFLRENDPVFNGYVVKITGDSIIFKETLQDKLGKPFTREVTKKISTPAV